MFRVTRQTDYAFRIVLFLAKYPEGERISSSLICEEMLVPAAISPRIVAKLAKGGFLSTFPGRDGGIQLAKKAKDISMWDILDLFEGPIYLSDCLADEEKCPLGSKCPVRLRWSPIQDVLHRELDKITFDELSIDAKMMEIFQVSTGGGI